MNEYRENLADLLSRSFPIGSRWRHGDVTLVVDKVAARYVVFNVVKGLPAYKLPASRMYFASDDVLRHMEPAPIKATVDDIKTDTFWEARDDADDMYPWYEVFVYDIVSYSERERKGPAVLVAKSGAGTQFIKLIDAEKFLEWYKPYGSQG